MGPRVAIAVAAIAGALSLPAAVLLFAATGANGEYESARREAMSRGLPLALPKPRTSRSVLESVGTLREFHRYHREINAAETVTKLEFWMNTVKKAHSALHKIANSEQGTTRWWQDDISDIETSSRLCAVFGLVAVYRGNFQQCLEELRCLRKLAAVLPLYETSAAYAHNSLIERYCFLSQFMAENTKSESNIIQLEKDAEGIPIPNYLIAATHVPAEALEYIDAMPDQGSGCVPDDTLAFDMAIQRSKPRLNREKTHAIESGIIAIANWSNLNRIIDLRRNEDYVSVVASNLKGAELESSLHLLALRATLRAHRYRVRGEPWPTMKKLESERLVTKHPVNGAYFVWAAGNGTSRVTSFPNCDPTSAYRVVIRRDGALLSKWAPELLSKLEAKK